VFNEIIERGKDIKQLGKDLTEHFRHMMIMKIGGQDLKGLVEYPAAVRQRLAIQAERITIVGILKVIELFIEAQETARVMETLRMPLELAFAKMAYGGPSQAQVQPVAAPTTPAMPSAPPVSSEMSLQGIQEQWNALTHEVSRRKMSVATYLQDGLPYAFRDGQLTIAFNKDHTFQKESLETKESLALLEKVFSEKLGTAVRVVLKIRDVTVPKKDETVVKAALEMFGGEVIKEWHSE
jgi:DNA polymerase III gamma/tau subunit